MATAKTKSIKRIVKKFQKEVSKRDSKKKEVKHTIHFGKSGSFEVNEWLYKHFNGLKNRKDQKHYRNLFRVLTGLKKKVK